MAFPQTPLAVRVDLQIGGVWTDITSDTLARDGSSSITIERGRADEASRADPSKCRLSLKNQTGKYSPRNPTSPYYGILGRNAPLRVGIGTPPAAAATTGQTGTSIVAPSVAAESAGLLACVWGAVPVGNFTLPGAFTTDLEKDGDLSTWGAGRKNVLTGATGTSTATFSLAATAAVAMSVWTPGVSASAGFSNLEKIGADCQVTVTAVAGDYLLAFYGWSSDPGDLMWAAVRDQDAAGAPWMLLGDTGASSGPRLKAYIRRVPAAMSTNVWFPGPGRGSGDTFGRVYVLTGVTDYYPRFTGEVSEWPPKWDLSGKDVWTPITASGITRRLAQGAASLRSAVYREFTASPSVVAYWPMEDPAGSTSFASALPGAPPMQFLGATPALAADDSFACADALPTFTLGGARGQVPAYTSTNQFLVGALMSFPVAGMVSGSTLLTISCFGGTVRTWTVKYDSGGPGFRVEAFDVDGVSLWNTVYGPWTPTVLGSRFFLYFTAQTSGANIVWILKYIPIVAGVDFPSSSQQVTGTILTQTVGRVTSVAVGGVSDLNGPPTIGHVIVASDPLALFTTSAWRALVAWNGEIAGDRIVRICREESVNVHIPQGYGTEAMGPQRPATLLSLLRECEATDGGVLYEPKGSIGIAYRPRESKQNRPAGLTLSYSGGNISEPFEPTDDDQGLVNDVTANRVGGSSARATLDVGPLSTLPPPAGVGRYDDSVDLNLFSDAQLPDQAGWRVHIGTWDEARYPSIRVDLAKNPTLAGAIAAADVGDLVTITGLPAWLPPGPNDLILEGYTETLGHPIDWDVVGNHSPAGPYRVTVLNSTTYGRLDSAYTVLNGSLTTTATTLPLLINPPAGGTPFAGTFTPWATTAALPGEFPFDIVVGGEQMTVTAAAAAVSNVQNLTVTRSVNGVVKAHVTAEAVHLVRPTAVAL